MIQSLIKMIVVCIDYYFKLYAYLFLINVLFESFHPSPMKCNTDLTRPLWTENYSVIRIINDSK